jgi:hypothetical protein
MGFQSYEILFSNMCIEFCGFIAITLQLYPEVALVFIQPHHPAVAVLIIGRGYFGFPHSRFILV